MLARKRILRDVNQAVSSKLDGIYYFPDDSMETGTALLVGKPGTPYHGGYYFFRITFPADYPFSPIQVTTLTQDGKTRFNPNMYREGKVCLSILNTWHDGPQWSGVQTLESVLLVIMADVLTANPLENEPAFRGCGASPDALVYNRLVFHANLRTLLRMLTDPPEFAKPHAAILAEQFRKHRDELLRLAADASVHDGKTEACRVFSMSETYDFVGIIKKLSEIKI